MSPGQQLCLLPGLMCPDATATGGGVSSRDMATGSQAVPSRCRGACKAQMQMGTSSDIRRRSRPPALWTTVTRAV